MKVSWPFGAALRREAPSRLMLRWLKTVVVSDEEKAPVRRQAGTGKASASESLLTCRNPKTTSKPGCFGQRRGHIHGGRIRRGRIRGPAAAGWSTRIPARRIAAPAAGEKC